MQRRNDRNSSRDDLQFRRDNSAWGGGRRATSREFDRRERGDYRADDSRHEFNSDVNSYQRPGDYRSTDYNRTTNYTDEHDRAFGPSRDYIDNGRIEMGRPRADQNMSYGTDRFDVNDQSSRAGRYGQDFYGKGREDSYGENFSSGSGSYKENYGGRDSWNSDRYSERRFGSNYGSHAGKGPKGYQRSEERIKEEVCDILMHDHRVDASNIEVSIENGVVVLKGTVDDRQSKRLAEECIENVQGVTDVRNELKVQSAGLINQNDTMSELSGSGLASSLGKPSSSAASDKNDKTWSDAGKIKGAKESVKSSEDKRLM